MPILSAIQRLILYKRARCPNCNDPLKEHTDKCHHSGGCLTNCQWSYGYSVAQLKKLGLLI